MQVFARLVLLVVACCLLLVSGDLCKGFHLDCAGIVIVAFIRCLSSAYLLGVCPLAL